MICFYNGEIVLFSVYLAVPLSVLFPQMPFFHALFFTTLLLCSLFPVKQFSLHGCKNVKGR